MVGIKPEWRISRGCETTLVENDGRLAATDNSIPGLEIRDGDDDLGDCSLDRVGEVEGMVVRSWWSLDPLLYCGLASTCNRTVSESTLKQACRLARTERYAGLVRSGIRYGHVAV